MKKYKITKRATKKPSPLVNPLSINQRIFKLFKLPPEFIKKLPENKEYTFMVGQSMGILKADSLCKNDDKEEFEDILDFLYGQKIEEYNRKKLQQYDGKLSKKLEDAGFIKDERHPIELMKLYGNNEETFTAGLILGVREGFKLCGMFNFFKRKKAVDQASDIVNKFMSRI